MFQARGSVTAAGARAYDVLADCYDRFEGDRSRQASYLRSLIQCHRPEATTLLELGCGTGALLRLLRDDYDVAGVDASAAMLEVAERSIEAYRLSLGDITCVRLCRKFDVVLCAYDTINHLRPFAAWKALFRVASDHLAGDGVFVFDMNTVRRLRELAAAPPIARQFGDDGLFLVDVQESAPDRADARSGSDCVSTVWRVDVVEREGARSSRQAAVIEEVAFDAARVEQALGQHFSSVRAYDPEGAPSEATSRLHFVCSAGAL